MDMLEKKLIDHYKCFQTETLWVDEHNEDDGFLSIQYILVFLLVFVAG